MELIAQKREVFGKKTKNLREERKIPGVIFGPNMDSISLTIDFNNFVKLYRQVGETSLVELNIDNGNKESVLIKDVQLDPITLNPIHVGFYKVNLKEKIKADIPVELMGEDENEMIKNGEAIALLLINEIPVEAYPTDLPSDFVVDVSRLTEIGEGVTLGELDYNREKVEIMEYEDDEIVAKLDYAQMEEEEEEVSELTEEELLEGIEATEETAEEEEEGEEAPESKKEREEE